MSEKLEGIAGDIGGQAQEHVGETIGDTTTRAKSFYNQAAGEAQEQVARLGEVIRDQPLTAALIALGLGYILGRLTA